MVPPHVRLRLTLCGRVIPAPTWPAGTRLAAFDPARDADRVHATLEAGYAQGGGRVPAFSVWWPATRSDADYDPSLLFLAVDDADRLAGVALCWRSGFVKDLVVARSWRRQGVGGALLLAAFRCFTERGLASVDLKVELDNPSGAERLYRRLDMQPA